MNLELIIQCCVMGGCAGWIVGELRVAKRKILESNQSIEERIKLIQEFTGSRKKFQQKRSPPLGFDPFLTHNSKGGIYENE